MSYMLLMRMTSFCISNGLLSQLDHKYYEFVIPHVRKSFFIVASHTIFAVLLFQLANFGIIEFDLILILCFLRINYLLAGGLYPVGFHLLNVALHCVISALMIDVFSILIGGLSHDGRGSKLNLSPKASFLAALFFAAHPVHTESVSRAGRRDSAGCLRPVNNIPLQCSVSQCSLMLHEIYITRPVEKKASRSWCASHRWALRSDAAINSNPTLVLTWHGCI